ncbi:DUF4349 domain-containing protein [Chryseobacterium camelliae]|uniref:DUF4349 domain-containing protein n=1 Tax=Chryseobacterium camelliae TaxID=1265445 RepID=UPI002858020D|nr:DUF4349 domain-containing protein [Chryseobacterium camelliae]MDR6513977.1 hypothetical protein [Chryseobacterium camelliae]
MKNVFLPVCFLMFIHCSQSGNKNALNADFVNSAPETAVTAVSEASPPPPPMQEPLQDKAISNAATGDQKLRTPVEAISKKIIKNGEMRIQVTDIRKAQDQVNAIIQKNKAYIQKEEFRNTDTDETLNIMVRVPHQGFDALVNSFSDGVGAVLSKNISSDDVTEEYTDVSIKLANKRIYLEKYRDMLKSAKTTKDMLEIQENIRELEDEIDVSEGKLRFIDDRVNYSTLDLSLYKEKVRTSATSNIGFGSRFGDSLTEGWNTFVSFFLGLISLWPFLLLIPVFVVLLKRWRRRKTNKS